MSQSLCQFPVVGEQNQTSAGRIESADREQSIVTGHQIDDARSALWVAIGAQNASRFMNGEVGRSMTFEWFAVDGDLGGFDIDFGTDLGDRFAIDFDATVGDQLIDSTPRAKTSRSK